VATWDLTKVFAGDPDNVAWIDDVKLDHDGHPHLLFSVKKDGRGTHGKGGMDIRFHHGKWDGRAWRTSWHDPRTILVWMRGTYRNNRGEWTTAVVATVLPVRSR
jgi:hypothetical protein